MGKTNLVVDWFKHKIITDLKDIDTRTFYCDKFGTVYKLWECGHLEFAYQAVLEHYYDEWEKEDEKLYSQVGRHYDVEDFILNKGWIKIAFFNRTGYHLYIGKILKCFKELPYKQKCIVYDFLNINKAKSFYFRENFIPTEKIFDEA